MSNLQQYFYNWKIGMIAVLKLIKSHTHFFDSFPKSFYAKPFFVPKKSLFESFWPCDFREYFFASTQILQISSIESWTNK